MVSFWIYHQSQYLIMQRPKSSLFEGGRKASSARARKSLQNIKTSCHNNRKQVTEHTKALPTKTRKKPEPVEPEPEPVEPVPVVPEPEPVEQVKPKKTRKTRAKKTESKE